MGLLDRAKEMAGQGAEAAKKAAEVAKVKAGDMQARRRADDLAQQLGYLTVRQRTEGFDAGAEPQRLIDEIVAIQTELAVQSGLIERPTFSILIVVLLAVVALVPIGASVAATSASSARRERAWQLEAVGLAVVGTIWLALMIGGGPGA